MKHSDDDNELFNRLEAEMAADSDGAVVDLSKARSARTESADRAPDASPDSGPDRSGDLRPTESADPGEGSRATPARPWSTVRRRLSQAPV